MKKYRSNKIFIVSGSRAEIGILSNLISKYKKNKLTLILTGQHLDRNYQNLFDLYDKKLIKTKFIDIKLKDSEPASILNSISIGVSKFGKLFNKYKPKIVIILGDRYELLSVAVAAYFSNTKIAHIHGGEKTIGSMDDTIRHVITKFSNLHFVSNKIYKNRVIQLGEDPKTIFNVGGLSAERIKNFKPLKKNQLRKILDIKFDKFNFTITINSFFEKSISTSKAVNNLLLALKKQKNTNLFFTSSNSDLKSDQINKLITNFCKKNKNSYFFYNLGYKNYLSLLSKCDLCIGNSSSGVLEVPSLKIATINLGTRQTGRIKSDSIIDSDYQYENILSAIKKSKSRNFQKKLMLSNNPIYRKNTATNIKKIISSNLNRKVLLKSFYDLN
tara:strand:+ start:198 stop:1355 length:1158 start_codon:yes stop_codon:yes gene_type:complete